MGSCVVGAIAVDTESETDPTLSISEEDQETIQDTVTVTTFLIVGCIGLPFGALSLFSFSKIGRIGREKKRDRDRRAMSEDLSAMREQMAMQAAQQKTVPPQPTNEEDMQIKLAGKFWRQGKKTAAIEILESMPHNARAQAILKKIRSE
jgi:hypothetical protein